MNEAYLLLILKLIDYCTDQGAQPVLHFDSVKRATSDIMIHGWARDSFRSAQKSLLYTFVARGIEIPEPVFVPPGSTPGLELADFVSFVIARYHLRQITPTEITLDPARLGTATYLLVERSGDMVYKTSCGYPWTDVWS